MQTLYGIGTTLYGKREEHGDGTYLATRWFVIFDIPLIPFETSRVKVALENKELFSNRRTYQTEPAPRNLKQIGITFLLTCSFIAGFIVLVNWPSEYDLFEAMPAVIILTWYFGLRYFLKHGRF